MNKPATPRGDFEIWIGPQVADGYQVKVESPAGDADSHLHLPLDSPEFTAALERIQALDTDRTLLKEFGTRLFEALFTAPIRTRYGHSLGLTDGHLRIKLKIDPPELMLLPWELLYDPETRRFLCFSPETPLVRYLSFARPPEALELQPPLRILVIISSPRDAVSLDVNRERRNLETALKDLVGKGLVHLDYVERAIPRLIQDCLREGFHAVHYIGHGGFDESTGQGFLLLEDEEGRSYPVDAEQLAILFQRDIRLVVLNACETARVAETNPFLSVGPALVTTAEVPAVVAMQFPVPDDSAITFAQGFYAALSDFRPVDVAVSEARQAVMWEVGLGEVDWAAPVLFMRAPDGEIFRRGKEVRDSSLFTQEERRGRHREREREWEAKGIYTEENIQKQITHLKKLLDRHYRNLQHLESQQAMYGLGTPVPIINQIEYEQKEIARLEEKLARLQRQWKA